MPTEYTGLSSIDGTRYLQDDGSHCIKCGALWPYDTDHTCSAPGPTQLDFETLARVNLERCVSPEGFNHPLSAWSLSDWFMAATGEFGEAANKAKKLNRVRDGIRGNKETPEELRQGLAGEIADAVIYLDLLAQSQGISLGRAVAVTFNRKSEEIGAPHRLPE